MGLISRIRNKRIAREESYIEREQAAIRAAVTGEKPDVDLDTQTEAMIAKLKEIMEQTFSLKRDIIDSLPSIILGAVLFTAAYFLVGLTIAIPTLIFGMLISAILVSRFYHPAYTKVYYDKIDSEHGTINRGTYYIPAKVMQYIQTDGLVNTVRSTDGGVAYAVDDMEFADNGDYPVWMHFQWHHFPEHRFIAKASVYDTIVPFVNLTLQYDETLKETLDFESFVFGKDLTDRRLRIIESAKTDEAGAATAELNDLKNRLKQMKEMLDSMEKKGEVADNNGGQ
ncbi:hypothetical protein DMB44_05365 [Thermoplasma sp. Kam2015]|uniref:hypothetical protein n=1 Tax=Thermoplasma sp. Kam2015 TaxID=2094122 RepID=UPI000D9EC3B7|nr:hypothetical protein [Thermoplasma sp. Kam2015]PYB68150.1 hypothetical protein DMB44_05365 [Thermoplasma sp. Kam2015]